VPARNIRCAKPRKRDAAMRDGMIEQGMDMPQKPFTLEELAAVARDVLGPPQEPGR